MEGPRPALACVLLAALGCASKPLPKPCATDADCEPDTQCLPAGGASYCFAEAGPLALSPPMVSLLAETTQQFTASFGGAASAVVTWSVEEGADGGTIDASGLYTAPMTAGTFHVVATSTVGGATGEAAVTVTRPPPGSLDVTFGDGGLVIFNPLDDAGCGEKQCAVAIVILDGGIIAVAGDSASTISPSVVTVVELDSTGAFVPGFTRVGPHPGLTGTMVLDAEGGLLISSNSATNPFYEDVERRLPNGDLDEQFGTGGVVVDAGYVAAGTAPLALLSDEGFVVGNTIETDAGGVLPSAIAYDSRGRETLYYGSVGSTASYDEQILYVSQPGNSTLVSVVDVPVQLGSNLGIAIARGGAFSDTQVDSSKAFPPAQPIVLATASLGTDSLIFGGSPAFVDVFDLDGGFEVGLAETVGSWLSEIDAGSVNGIQVDTRSDLLLALNPESQAYEAGMVVARLTRLGVVDDSFGHGGLAIVPAEAPVMAIGIAVDALGKIIVVGGTANRWAIARLWP